MNKISWDQFHIDCRKLAAIITDSEKKYDKLICITRGGVFVGGLMAHFLNMRNITTIALRLYDQAGQRRDVIEELSAPDMPPVGSRLLVVDDLLDSGRTFAYILKKWGKDYILDFAVLYDKGGGDIRPSFCVEDIPNVWVNFPWEVGDRD